MADLETAVRAKLASFENAACMSVEGCDAVGFDEMRETLLAVLDLHKGDDDDHLCPSEIVGYSVQHWHNAADPCPTVRVIAEKLGVEVDGG